MSLTTAVQPTSRPAHVVAALRYDGPSAVAFVDCACGERVDSIAAWYAHLRAEGQHPTLSNIGPPRAPVAWQSAGTRDPDAIGQGEC